MIRYTISLVALVASAVLGQPVVPRLRLGETSKPSTQAPPQISLAVFPRPGSTGLPSLPELRLMGDGAGHSLESLRDALSDLDRDVLLIDSAGNRISVHTSLSFERVYPPLFNMKLAPNLPLTPGKYSGSIRGKTKSQVTNPDPQLVNATGGLEFDFVVGSNPELTRIETCRRNNETLVSLYFSEPINPEALGSSTIRISSATASSSQLCALLPLDPTLETSAIAFSCGASAGPFELTIAPLTSKSGLAVRVMNDMTQYFSRDVAIDSEGCSSTRNRQ